MEIAYQGNVSQCTTKEIVDKSLDLCYPLVEHWGKCLCQRLAVSEVEFVVTEFVFSDGHRSSEPDIADMLCPAPCLPASPGVTSPDPVVCAVQDVDVPVSRQVASVLVNTDEGIIRTDRESG